MIEFGQELARPVTPLGILVKQLHETVKIAQSTEAHPRLTESLQQVYSLAAGLDPYLDECTTPESSALVNLDRKTREESWNQRFSNGETVRHLEQEMLSGHLEGQTLKMFAYMMRAKRVLEIGMFTGYSALAIAEALPEDGKVIACEVDRYVSEFAQACFDRSPHGYKIYIEVRPALESLQKLADARESFELVFIDADKKEYVDYFNLLLEGDLLAPNGVICVDNTLLQGQPYLPPGQRSPNGEAIAHFNRVVADDPRVEQVLLPLRDGLTVIRRKQ
ncbi:MAG: O-methyltransferase [Cyanophyceae cyanobacterium]